MTAKLDRDEDVPTLHVAKNPEPGERELRDILDATPDGIVVTDATGRITYVNPAAVGIFASRASQLVSNQLSDLLPHVAAGQRTGTFQRRDGAQIAIEASASSFEDALGRPRRVYALRNLSAREEVDDSADPAGRDALTGLRNRTHLITELAARLSAAKRYGTSGALLCVDIDHLKAINDKLGHAAGDVVLRALARTLRCNTRASDVVARMGPGKLAVVLTHVSTAAALQSATKLVQLVHEIPMTDLEHPVAFTVSIGVATFSDHDSVAAVLAAADAGVERTRSEGRDRAEA